MSAATATGSRSRPPAEVTVGVPKPWQAALEFWRRHLNPIWFLAAGLAVFFAIGSEHFLELSNLKNIILQVALMGFLAIGLTPIMISGNIDLTVGSVLGLTACVAINLEGSGVAVAIVAALAAGAALGVFNGVLVEKTGVNSFIVTLGGMIGIRGLAFLYVGDTSLSPVDDRLTQIGSLSIGPFNAIVMVFALCVVAFHIYLQHLPAGRNTYAIGGNRAATRDAGVPVSRYVIVNFGLSGLMAAIAGIAMASNLGAATPSYGTDYELWAIIAVVLGGTSLRGGAGTVIGTLGAVVALAVLRNGLALINVQPFYEPVIMGLTLIGALIVDRQVYRRRSSGHRE